MCKCCEEIEFWKQNINKSEEIKCKLVIRNKHNTGTITTRAFNLNYCSMCGRKISKGE